MWRLADLDGLVVNFNSRGRPAKRLYWLLKESKLETLKDEIKNIRANINRILVTFGAVSIIARLLTPSLTTYARRSSTRLELELQSFQVNTHQN
jgi:hypothetical protein